MDSTDSNEGPPAASPDSLSTHVLTTVADAKGCTTEELKPLYEVINPEALDELFAPRVSGTTRAGGSVSFQYDGYQVTVTSENDVELELLQDD
jgi:hypothetical protein